MDSLNLCLDTETPPKESLGRPNLIKIHHLNKIRTKLKHHPNRPS